MASLEDGKPVKNLAGRGGIVFIIQQYRPGPLDRGAMRREFEQGLVEVGNILRQDFESTAEHWENKPDFQVVTAFRGNRLEVNVYTENPVYIMLNNGVLPHTIEPIDADGVLAFHEGYTAKTDPGIVRLGETFVSQFGGLGMGLEGSLRSVQDHEGGESGGMVFTKEVEHPGVEARNFDIRIRMGRLATVDRVMQKAAGEAAKKSGHWLGSIRVNLISPTNRPQPVPFSPPPPPQTPTISIPNFRGNFNFVPSSGPASSSSNNPAFRGSRNFVGSRR